MQNMLQSTTRLFQMIMGIHFFLSNSCDFLTKASQHIWIYQDYLEIFLMMIK